jgi:hypothetical protein
MTRISWLILIAAILLPQAGGAARGDDDIKAKSPVQPAPAPEASTNQQILQTLMDLRDSQLSVLQAQLEILSILRSQGKMAPAAAVQHDEALVAGHRSGQKDHKRRPEPSLTAAR